MEELGTLDLGKEQEFAYRRWLLDLATPEEIMIVANLPDHGETGDLIWIVEDDLCSDYLFGRLDQEEMEAFELVYLREPRHQSKLFLKKEILTHLLDRRICELIHNRIDQLKKQEARE